MTAGEDVIFMKIAICDDDLNDIATIRKHILAHPLSHEIIEFTAPESFLRRIYSDESFDLLFLDVRMPDADGWEVARELKQSKVKLFIAMVTVVGEYINDCFDRVDWFAEKPVSPEKIHKMMDFAYGELYPKAFEFQTEIGIISLTAPEMIYIEANRNNLVIHTTTRVYTHRMSLTEMEHILSPLRSFTRIHHSYILNLSFLDKIDGHFAVIKTGEKLPVSRNSKKSFFETIARYIRNGWL
jgi:DNA-binding LytR/AlgR family response regulator